MGNLQEGINTITVFTCQPTPTAISPGSSHPFEHGKFALAGSPAERIELRIGIRKEYSGAIEFHYTPFFEQHYLVEVIDLRDIS